MDKFLGPFSGLVPLKVKIVQQKFKGRACIEELFDTPFNLGYGGWGVQRPPPHVLWLGKYPMIERIKENN